MKNGISKLRKKIKSNLLIRLAKSKKENNYLKERLEEEILKHKQLYDEIKLKDIKIRELSLELNYGKDISNE